jgi:hypothetical protein
VRVCACVCVCVCVRVSDESVAHLFIFRFRFRVCYSVVQENDPIVPARCIREDDFLANRYIVNVITEEGAHSMDWPTGWAPWTASKSADTIREGSWGVGVVCDFLIAVLEDLKEGGENGAGGRGGAGRPKVARTPSKMIYL